MAIELSNILTISAMEWFEITGKSKDDYELKGVHCDSTMRGINREFLEEVPNDAEVVVAYTHSGATEGASGGMNGMVYASGTALIPRK